MIVINEILGYLRKPLYDPAYSSGQSTHEALKAQLYAFGYCSGYVPILEARTTLADGRNGRLDCLFVERGTKRPVVGIEVESSVRKKSISKLRSITLDTRIIVAFAGTDDWKQFTVDSQRCPSGDVVNVLCLGWLDCKKSFMGTIL